MKNVFVILKDGSQCSLEEWQNLYGLPVGSDSVGRHFSLKDPKLAQDLRDYGQLIVNELLVRVMDAFREAIDLPLTINSFNRTEEKQAALRAAGYQAAEHSPHVAKMAVDINTTSPTQTRAWVVILKNTAAQRGIKIRIGSEQYLSVGQTFIHFDVCPEFYAKNKPFNKQVHPAAWEQVTYW